MTNAPYHRAAFINAIAEEGTKQEAVDWLQKTWNERCELANRIESLEAENARLRWPHAPTIQPQETGIAAPCPKCGVIGGCICHTAIVPPLNVPEEPDIASPSLPSQAFREGYRQGFIDAWNTLKGGDT